MLIELITNFIKINSPQNETHAGTSSVVPLLHASSTHAAPQPHASSAHANALPHSSPIYAQDMQGMQDTHMVLTNKPAKETVEVLKNLKPLGFKGEEKERNKNTIKTFLSRWGEINDMRGT